MKKTLLLAAMLALASALTFADNPTTCPGYRSPATLSDYLSMSPAGCLIGSERYTGFGYSGNAAAPLASDIMVTPNDADPYGQGLILTGLGGAPLSFGPGADAVLTFQMYHPWLIHNEFEFNNVIGPLSGTQFSCEDGTFSPDGSCSSGYTLFLALNGTGRTGGRVRGSMFGLARSEDVSTELRTGTAGASVDSIHQYFAFMPEPSTLVLLGTGLVGLALRRRSRAR